MSTDFPLVVPRTRTIQLGGGATATRETFRADLQTQSLADVRAFIRQITTDTTAQQIALGNPPQVLEVDGRAGKPLAQVQRTTVVLYGAVLAQSAMREAENALRAAITSSTVTRTGRLADVTGSWCWYYIRKGQPAAQVNAGSKLPAFAVGDMLVLAPKDVPYATIVNRAVARAGAIKPKGKGRAAGKRQNRGFLFWTAQALRSRTVFKQFSVRVVFTQNHQVPGEIMNRTSGTGVIVIRPRARRVK